MRHRRLLVLKHKIVRRCPALSCAQAQTACTPLTRPHESAGQIATVVFLTARSTPAHSRISNATRVGVPQRRIAISKTHRSALRSVCCERHVDSGGCEARPVTGRSTYAGFSGTQVTDAGMDHLEELTSLQTLILSGTQAGLVHLRGLKSADAQAQIHSSHQRWCGATAPHCLN